MMAGQTGSNDKTIHANGCLSPANAVVLDRGATGAESFGQPCYNIPSIPAEATAARLSWKYYGQAPVCDAPQHIQAIQNSPPGASSQTTTNAQNSHRPHLPCTTPATDPQSAQPPP